MDGIRLSDFLLIVFGSFDGKLLFILIDATKYTVYLSLTAFAGGGLLGLLLTFFSISNFSFLKNFSTTYIWLFQGIPLLMLLFLIGLGIPTFFSLPLSPWFAASIALTMFTSAYLGEVWRTIVQSIPQGQWEAADALGLSFTTKLLKVIFPQAIRASLPPTVGFLVQIIKGTSMAYIIDFNDLMRWGKKIANSPVPGTEPFIIFPIMALIYFCLCFPLTRLSRWLETRIK